MSNKEKILDLYYNQHLIQNEIAKIVDNTTQYVSKVVRTDKRNKEEKEKRKKEKEQICRSTVGAASGRKSGFRNERQWDRKENTG